MPTTNLPTPAIVPEPIRICLFTDTLGDVNGVSRFVRSMARQARALDRSLTIMASTRLGGDEVASVHNFKPRLAMPMPRYRQLEMTLPPVRLMLDAARRARPDVVHLSTPGPVGLAGLWIARRLGVPAVGTYHTDFPAFVGQLFGDEVIAEVARCAMASFYRRLACVLARSGAYVGRIERLGVPRSAIRVLRAGVDTDAFGARYADRAIWDRLGLRRNTVKVLCCGRVSVEKNLPMLVQVWQRVSAGWPTDHPRAELVVVGDGPYLRAMRRALGGTPAHFLGFRYGAELATLYASSDLLVFPSMTDTLGQVVMEAQASGLAALVSTAGGPAEVIEDGVTGLAIPGDDPSVWVERLWALIADGPRRARMGTAACARMEGRTIGASFEHFWHLHERVVYDGGV